MILRKHRQLKNILLMVLLSGILAFSAFVILTFSIIHRQVEHITVIAMNEYHLDAIESLTNLIESNHHSFEQKNSAIWALGQFADPKALPFLEELNTRTLGSTPCRRSSEICKDEIERAMKWCRQGNLTNWMYRDFEK